MAGAGTAKKFEAAQRSLRLTISSFGDRPTQWRVSFVKNEKGDTRQLETTVSTGEWAGHADTLDDHIKALAWLARQLWGEMEARNG